MDPILQAALAAVGGTVLGVVGKWALERLLKRGDVAEEKHAESLERKVDLLLEKVSTMELNAVTAHERALAIQAKHEELRERINGGLTNHADRLRLLEEFRVEVRTRFKMKEE